MSNIINFGRKKYCTSRQQPAKCKIDWQKSDNVLILHYAVTFIEFEFVILYQTYEQSCWWSINRFVVVEEAGEHLLTDRSTTCSVSTTVEPWIRRSCHRKSDRSRHMDVPFGTKLMLAIWRPSRSDWPSVAWNVRSVDWHPQENTWTEQPCSLASLTSKRSCGSIQLSPSAYCL